MATRWSRVGAILGAIGALILLVVIGWFIYQAGYRDGEARQAGVATEQEAAPSVKEGDKEGLVEYRSEKGVVIKLDRRLDNTAITSPLTITGEAPGNWSFEGDFPVELRGADDSLLVTAPAILQGDWMTARYVPFRVTLTFTNENTTESGELILRKSNPSGETAGDDRVVIPVRFTVRE